MEKMHAAMASLEPVDQDRACSYGKKDWPALKVLNFKGLLHYDLGAHL
jgi:hypothetical protein